MPVANIVCAQAVTAWPARRQGNNLRRDCNRDMSVPRRRRTSNMDRSITTETQDACRWQLRGARPPFRRD